MARSAAAVSPSGMVSRRCTGRAWRSTSSTSATEAPAGRANSAARSGPSPRVAQAARAKTRASRITPARLRTAGDGLGAAARDDDLGRLSQRPRGAVQPQRLPGRRRRPAAPPPAAHRQPQRRSRLMPPRVRRAARKTMLALVPPKPKLFDSATSIGRSCATLATRSMALSRRASRGSGSAARPGRGSPGPRRSPRPRRRRPAGGRWRTWSRTSPGLPAASPKSRSTAPSSSSSPSGVEVPWALT